MIASDPRDPESPSQFPGGQRSAPDSSSVPSSNPFAGAPSGPPDALLATIYAELRAIAAAHMRREHEGHTLQPTALVHEAFLRVCARGEIDWRNRPQVLAAAATAMRRILVDHARGKRGLKRGGSGRDGSAPMARREPFDPERVVAAPVPVDDVIALDEALTALAIKDERLARVVELRYFAGLSVDETAEVVGTSARTVNDDFRVAKAWLRVALGE